MVRFYEVPHDDDQFTGGYEEEDQVVEGSEA
jgi:hypothetical protein